LRFAAGSNDSLQLAGADNVKPASRPGEGPQN